jgi:DNA-binding PadR family transcriptional regulator
MADINFEQKQDFVLAVLSQTEGASYSPVQLQKLFFLIDRNIGDEIGGPYFNFTPYHYGPFDKNLYRILDNLISQNLVFVREEGFNKIRKYGLTAEGQRQGKLIEDKILPIYLPYVKDLENFVLKLSFEELIQSIYKAYPDMKVNSIFHS